MNDLILATPLVTEAKGAVADATATRKHVIFGGEIYQLCKCIGGGYDAFTVSCIGQLPAAWLITEAHAITAPTFMRARPRHIMVNCSFSIS